MITEQGRVVALESDGVWVETASQSACASCAARKGCGQSLLAQLDGHRTYIKASFNGHPPAHFREGDQVTIGVHEAAVLRGSLMIYVLPLLGLLMGALAGHSLDFSEAFVAASALGGLVLAALAVRHFCRRYDDDARFQPVIMRPATDAVPISVPPSPALNPRT